MRILYASHFGGLGGAERSLLELVLAVRARGIEPILLAPPGPLYEAAHAQHVAVVPWAARRLVRGHGLDALARLPVAWSDVAAALRRFAPFVIHANTTTARMWLGPIPALHGCRVVWHWRDFERRRAPVSAFTADVVIAISRAIYRHAESVLPRRRIALVHNGIEEPVARLSPGELRRRLGIGAEARLVAMGGQAVPRKGHAQLIAALTALMQRDADLHAVLACTSHDAAARAYALHLRRLASAQPRIQIFDDMESLADVFRAADVVAVPSHREPFGRVAVEAMLAARPVVATAVDGLAEIVSDGETGVLVRPNDVDELAHGLERVLSDREGWRERAVAARARALTAYSVARVAREVESIYRELAASRGGT